MCAAKIKHLNHVRDFMTDGEEALIQVWSADMPKAKHLRCFKHFEGNCKEKLRTLGICTTKQQSIFINREFRVKGKKEGILGAEDK